MHARSRAPIMITHNSPYRRCESVYSAVINVPHAPLIKADVPRVYRSREREFLFVRKPPPFRHHFIANYSIAHRSSRQLRARSGSRSLRRVALKSRRRAIASYRNRFELCFPEDRSEFLRRGSLDATASIVTSRASFFIVLIMRWSLPSLLKLRVVKLRFRQCDGNLLLLIV